jgi:hypothetical protein
MAAALFLVVWGLVRMRAPQSGGPEDIVRHDLPSPQTPERPQPLRESMADAGTAVAELTWRTADATMRPPGSLFEAAQQRLEPMPELDGAAVRPLTEAGAGVSSGLEPVTGSVRRALGMMFHDVPLGLSAGDDKPS